MNAMPLLSLLCFRTVWPDWAIFKFVGHKFYLKSSPNFSWLFGSFGKHQFLCKTCYILGNVFNNLDSLYSNIWSHCSTVNVNKLYGDDKFCTFFCRSADLSLFTVVDAVTRTKSRTLFKLTSLCIKTSLQPSSGQWGY